MGVGGVGGYTVPCNRLASIPVCSVPRISSSSTLSVAKIMQLLKMNENN